MSLRSGKCWSCRSARIIGEYCCWCSQNKIKFWGSVLSPEHVFVILTDPNLISQFENMCVYLKTSSQSKLESSGGGGAESVSKLVALWVGHTDTEQRSTQGSQNICRGSGLRSSSELLQLDHVSIWSSSKTHVTSNPCAYFARLLHWLQLTTCVCVCVSFVIITVQVHMMYMCVFIIVNANTRPPSEQHWCLCRFISSPTGICMLIPHSLFLDFCLIFLELESQQSGCMAMLESFALARRLGETIFWVTRSCCCNWADVKRKPVYVSIFIHRASCVGSESVWPPLFKSNVCKQGPSRKVKTPQPRGKKSPLCRCVTSERRPLWLLSYPPTLCISVQPADSCTVSPKCLCRIRSTLLSAKYKWIIQ